MPANFSPRNLFKSRRSKKVETLEVQNDGHLLDSPTTPPVAPKCEAETLIAPELSRPQNLSVAASIDEDNTKVTFSSGTKPQGPPKAPVVIVARGTPANTDARTKNPLLPTSAVQQTLEASSSNVAHAQAPPSVLLVTIDQVGPTEPDPRAKEPLPATEPAVQQTQAISASQRIWNAAYDSLENDNETAELVKTYVKTLKMVFKAEENPDTPSFEASDVSTELKDPIKRQMHMKKLLEDGRAKVFTASNIAKGVGDVAQFILSAKGMVDLAIQNIPQAALPWAGVCIGLQILLNPAKATRSNLAGITHVVSRMDWYCGMAEHLLNKDNIVVGNESFQTILEQLEKTVITLYKALLLYQMKSVCSYYRSQVLVFFRGLANLDDWDDDLKSVTDAEVALQTDSDQYNSWHAKSSLGRLVELAKTMEELLGDVRQTLRDFIDLQKEMQMDNKDTECLHDLFVVDPQDDMDTIEKKKDKLLDDAYKWILKTKEYEAFTNWSNDESPLSSCRLLWIKGHAGTGKTMLLIGIIRQLSDQPAVLSPTVSHFFCQGTDNKAHNNATAILRSLIWTLLVQQPHLISHLRSKYKYKGRSLFNDGNALVAMSRVFESILKDPGLLPVYFIIDALDECDQGLSDLVQIISTSLTLSGKVKWLVSSRPEVELKNPDTEGALVELDAQSLERPVKAYINHKLSTLKNKTGYTDSVLAEVLDEVSRRAENTFLWVALVFKQLDSQHGWHAVKIVKEMPPGLPELYDHMMIRIERDTMDLQYCKNVLVVTSLAYRPLTLSELAFLAGLGREIDPQTIVEECGSFLTTKENTVYLIHQSAKDYLKANHKSKLQRSGAVQGHADISRRSIDTISKLKKNIYALHPGSNLEDITVPSPDPLEGLQYCCVYWIQHLQKSDAKLCDYNQVYEFLQKHLLHWLEALGWMGETSKGILAIVLLETQISAEKSPNLYSFVHDAKRFALFNRSVIEQAPLQLYSSGLVFAPERCLIRREFEEDIPAWIQRKPKVQTNWNAILQTLEGHSDSVNSVAFSPNGKYVVSSSDDETVRLWDAVTGKALQTLEGHSDSVGSVAFSPDGKHVVSGSDDDTVRLWDVVTGKALQTLEGHSDSVNSVAFSPDGKHVVSGSDDETIRLWDAVTGKVLQTLEGHSDSVNSVAFSPDGKHIMSGSDDKTVRLWDAVTGRVQQTLEGHSYSVNSVAFSPDGKYVVSGSDDETVRLWDAVTGKVLQTLEDNLYSVISVAFSPDGKHVVSGSDDDTVRLWDVVTGKALQTLEGHSDSVNSVAFSPDGKHIMSGSDDKTVRLWDAVTGRVQQTLEGHSYSVNSVAFSPDGKYVVSGSDDKTVRLWDAVTGKALQTLEDHVTWVDSVVFSPDGKYVISEWDDEIVPLWDAVTGKALQTLERHSESVHTIAFSPDSKLVVFSSDDKIVRLWDAVMGKALQTLEGRVTWVKSVAFSPDGKYVVSSSNDKRVRLWDAVTGKAIQILQGHSDSVTPVAFSPDDRQVNTLRVLNNWVVEGSTKLLWLPFEYRNPSCTAIWNQSLVLGYSSGRVSIIGFKEGLKVI